MLYIAEILQQTAVAEDTAMAFNSEEEIGSSPWYEALATKSRCFFVFETWRSTGEQILHRKGGENFDVICHGKAARVAPEDGANAVIELAHRLF